MVRYLAELLCNYATIQEPTVPTLDITDLEKNQWRKIARQYGYEIIISDNQWVFMKNRLARRQLTCPQVAENGRIIATEFKMNPKVSLMMVGAYGVPMKSRNLGAGTILNRNLARKRMLDIFEDLETGFLENCKKNSAQALFSITGDLQDTISLTKVDNLNNTPR